MQPVSPVLPQPELENNVLTYWREQDIFAKTVEKRKNGKPFVFYDGPPFATGLPHFGHILQMALKDAVLRYKTMQGFNVPRKIGWDTHGLPVEYELEKELNLSGKPAIVAYGVENFVEAARGIVLRYTSEWASTMERMGRWVDISEPYATMDANYIESVWWAFSELYKQGLVYQDYRVGPYCPRCGTVISNFEVNQGYKDNVSDPSVVVKLKITDGTTDAGLLDAYVLVWTTTPWTLPSNVAVAVDAETDYAVVRYESELYVLAQALVSQVLPEGVVERTVKGHDLLGLTYAPLYPTAENHTYRVVAGHHVTIESGTGIVHMAPAFGEDDFVIGKKEGLPLVIMVEPDGSLKKGHGLPGEGLFVKQADKHIISDLNERGLLVSAQTIKHTYPFCWRCDTPLLYYPAVSWYVRVTALKDQLVEENNKINWLPEHLRDGRFGRWLEGARDWAISRDRFWGAPLPIWQCTNSEHKDAKPEVISSIEDLNARAQGAVPSDIHRPYIDAVTLACSCGAAMKRVPFVFDCWFESGSMPFAQHHYPFENKEHFVPESGVGYPADFIAEALDQTRGWFYTLHVLGVALFKQRAYKNVVVSGLLLASDGKKLSKRLRNYTEPELLFEEQGVDTLRLFLFTATTLGEDYRFSDQAVNDARRRWIVPLLNVLQYYVLSQGDVHAELETEPEHAMLDAWIKSRVAEAHMLVTAAMEGDDKNSPYDTVRACRTFGPLVEDLSTWYVRLSRGRQDAAFTHTLQQVLKQISITFAPFIPFLAEHIYQHLEQNDSVHMQDFHFDADWYDAALLEEMAQVRTLVTMGRDLRVKTKLPVRQPLALFEIAGAAISTTSQALLAQELQVEDVRVVATLSSDLEQSNNGQLSAGLKTELTETLKYKGEANALRRVIQDLRKQAKLQPHDVAQAVIDSVSPEVLEFLQPQLSHTAIVAESNQEVIAQTEESEPNTVTLYRV